VFGTRRGSRDRSGDGGGEALDAAVDAFVSDVAVVLNGMVGELPPQIANRLSSDVVLEAQNLALAVIDADGRHTDVELWAFLQAFAHRSDGSLQFSTPADMRSADLATGKQSWLGSVSALFDLIVAADAKHRTTHSWTYYDRAMRLAHTVCALDSRPSDDELRAVDQFRSMLVSTMTARGVARPGSFGATWGPGLGSAVGSGPIPTAPSGPPGQGDAAPAAAAQAATMQTPPPPQEPPVPIEQLLAELDDLVGLEGVKAEVRLVTNLLEVAKLRRDRNLPTVEGSRHLVFTGNPGTGKTTVARLLAKIYRTLGVVSSGHLIETDRAGLVAGFVGQTAIKVTEAFDRADQGVLLIDEAYSLVRGGEKDFGREAIDTIVKLVEDRRDRIVVIAAGYPVEMTEFTGANPGLQSRFPKTIHFEDYSNEQLVKIFGFQCKKASYHPTDDAKAAIAAYFAAAPRTKGFGNARLCRNLFEATIANQATRLMTVHRTLAAQGEADAKSSEAEPAADSSEAKPEGKAPVAASGLSDEDLLTITAADIPVPPGANAEVEPS
jgi:hypothetical protein